MKQPDEIPREYLSWIAMTEPEYIDDIRDPLRAAKGILTMTVIAVVFWSSLCGIVWLANTCIGGG